MCSKHVEAWNKTYCETNFVIKLAKYWDKYIEMHGQQNVKKIADKLSGTKAKPDYILGETSFYQLVPIF